MFLKLSEIFKYLHATPDSRCIVEGEQVLHANHLILCGKKSITKEKVNIAGLCLQTSALQGQPHQIEGILSMDGVDGVKIREMTCTCKAGLSGMCKHISALLLNCSRLYLILNKRGDVSCPGYFTDIEIQIYCLVLSLAFFSFCFRMDISSLEMLSSTDVECYWKKAKVQAKEMYKPEAIADYSCLKKTKSRLKAVRDLTEDEMKSCLKRGMECVPDSSITKHCSGRPKKLCLPSTSSHSSAVEIPEMPIISSILLHCESSEFLNTLSKDVCLEKFNLKACCINKWKAIEKCDLPQALMSKQNSADWNKFRQFRITGSDCYSIFTYRMENDDECWRRKSRQCFFPKKFSNDYVQHGRDEEKNALQAYKESIGEEVMEDLGIIISKKFLWLGFSPDAVLMNNNVPVKLVEIKCPFIGKTKDTDSFLTSCRYLKMTPSGLELNRKHPYYGQIQLGLSLLNLKSCDFVVYSSFSKKFLRLEVPFNPSFSRDLILSISEKYFSKMLHSICEK